MEFSEILYKSSSEAQARVLGAATGITKLTLDNSLASQVVLLVGTDWKNGKVTSLVTPSATSTPSASPSPSPSSTVDVNEGTAASTVCTEGNNRVKK